MTDTGSRAGEVVRGTDGRAVLRFRRVHDEPVADVWSAVTDPDRCARWFGRWSRLQGFRLGWAVYGSS